MRHKKHKNQLGVTKEHRQALMANMAASLIRAGRIKTTLKKAKALRPFIEKIITLAKAGSLHHRRQAISKVRDVAAVHLLFDEKVEDFRNRSGGYTRIYKLGNRIGDAAEMALIEFVAADDEGYRPRSKRRSGAKSTKAKAAPVAAAEEVEVATETAPAETAAEPTASAESAEDVATESTGEDTSAEGESSEEPKKD